MFTLQRHIEIPAPVEEVFEFHLDVRNLLRVSPPFIPAKLATFPERLGLGARIELRAQLGPMWLEWSFEVSEFRPDERFTVRQLCGPLKSWEHVHAFEPTEGGTRLTDTVRYELRGGLFGHVVPPTVIHRHIRRTLRHRQRRTLEVMAEGRGDAPGR